MSTVTFQNLPLDLLPCILQWLSFRLQDLSKIAQVSHTFRLTALPFLYERIRVRDTTRLKLLFHTLAPNPELCAMLRRLELRVWPLAANDAERIELEEQVLLTLKQAVNMKRLDFTRRGGMNDAMLHVLARHTALRVLEINGSPLHFSPIALLGLPPQLESLNIILPTREVMDLLPAALALISSTLKSLTLLGSKSTSIQNGSIAALVVLPFRLSSLTLAGCPRVTDKPLLDLLKQQGPSLRALALEALGTTPGFLRDVANQVDLTGLRAFKSTVDARIALLEEPDASFPSLAKLVYHCPNLIYFGFYCSGHHTNREGAVSYPVIPRHFISDLCEAACSSNLIQLECYGVVFPIHQLSVACAHMPKLQSLGVHVWAWEQDMLAHALNSLHHLKNIHILSVKEAEVESYQKLIQRLVPPVTQFGVRNRVWDVSRTLCNDSRIELSLQPFDWASQQIPSIFTFIRT